MSQTPKITAAQASRSSELRPAIQATAPIMTSVAASRPTSIQPYGIAAGERSMGKIVPVGTPMRRSQVDDHGRLEVGHGEGVQDDPGGQREGRQVPGLLINHRGRLPAPVDEQPMPMTEEASVLRRSSRPPPATRSSCTWWGRGTPSRLETGRPHHRRGEPSARGASDGARRGWIGDQRGGRRSLIGRHV